MLSVVLRILGMGMANYVSSFINNNMIGIEQVEDMLCTNKKFLQSCTSLLNEKSLFKFDADMLSIYRDMFMRLYFFIVSLSFFVRRC